MYSLNSGDDIKEMSAEIKDRLTVLDLGAKLFPGHRLNKHCKSPFREERNPSFSVYQDGRKWKDFTTGEGGDVFDFYIAATGCDSSKAFCDLRDMVGGVRVSYATKPKSEEQPQPEERKEPFHPLLERLTKEGFAHLAQLRGIPIEGLRIAAERGMLWVTTYSGQPAWIITDKARKCYLARRMDGKAWENGGKSKTLPGGQAAWPIGIQESADFPAIAICEGGPDFLSAFGHAWNSGVEKLVAPVCMSGASVSIPSEIVRMFEGKRVRIFIHNDTAGGAAFNRLGAQLYGVASKVDGFSFDGLVNDQGSPIKDLNDLFKVSSDYTDAFDFAHERTECQQ